MGRISLPICLILVCLAVVGARPLCASGSPVAEARAIIQDLGTRSGIPPLEALARLENASDAVCAALGAELRGARPETASRVVASFPQSSNTSVHAALVLGLSAERPEVARACLEALHALAFDQIAALRAAVSKLDATCWASLEERGVWARLIEEEVFELCSLESALLKAPDVHHRILAFALLVDLYAGKDAFRMLADRIVGHLVGTRASADEDGKGSAGDSASQAQDGDANAQAGDADEVPVDEAEVRKRMDDERMRERRRGAQVLFAELLIVDHVAFFDLGGSFENRQRRAQAFWDNYRIHIGEPGTWRNHLLWAQGGAASLELRLTALMAMDELCGQVMIEGERDPAAPRDDPPPQVPAFTGETPQTRIENFKKLDTRGGQRPRIRAVKKAFQDKYPG